MTHDNDHSRGAAAHCVFILYFVYSYKLQYKFYVKSSGSICKPEPGWKN